VLGRGGRSQHADLQGDARRGPAVSATVLRVQCDGVVVDIVVKRIWRAHTIHDHLSLQRSISRRNW